MRILVPFIIASCLASPVFSHEFWIEPESFQVETSAPLIANFRNGQNFKGGKLSWFARRIARSERRQGETVTPLTGRDGDLPAISVTPDKPGLLRLIHQTTSSTVSYQTAEEFAAFVDHKDLDTSAQPNPSFPMVESYRRFAKSLVAMGDGAGQDAHAGLEIELVALKNPYRDDLSAGLPMLLLYQGIPRADAQVEVFEKDASNLVTITRLRTDSKGQVILPVKKGHRYLVDSVLLRRPIPMEGPTQDWAQAEDQSATWESLWASLTFAVPD